MQRTLGFSLPPFLRRLYLEVNNGGFGPHFGLERIEMLGTLYKHYHRVNSQEPNWQWPYGLVPLIGGGGLYFECAYFTQPPHAIVLFDGLEARFEAWLADIELWGAALSPSKPEEV